MLERDGVNPIQELKRRGNGIAILYSLAGQVVVRVQYYDATIFAI